MEWTIRASRALGTKCRKVVRPGAWLTTVLLALATAGAILSQAEAPSATVWAPGEPAAIALASITGLAAILTALVSIAFSRSLTRSERGAELERTCKEIVRILDEHSSLTWREVGAHVWRVRGFRKFRHLDKVAQFISYEHPPESIVWREGKGVIGSCWRDNSDKIAKLEDLYERAPTKEDWMRLDREDRFNFGWEEVEATRVYTAVIAVPLRSKPGEALAEVCGVLSVDVSAQGKSDEFERVWTEQRESLSALVSVCRKIVAEW